MNNDVHNIIIYSLLIFDLWILNRIAEYWFAWNRNLTRKEKEGGYGSV